MEDVIPKVEEGDSVTLNDPDLCSETVETSRHTPFLQTILGTGERRAEEVVVDSSRILFDRQRSATSLKDETLLVMMGLPPFSVLGEGEFPLEEAELSVALSLETDRDLPEIDFDFSRGFGVFLLSRFLRVEGLLPIAFMSFRSEVSSFNDRPIDILFGISLVTIQDHEKVNQINHHSITQKKNIKYV